MAEINDIDLKLNIIADDQASTVLKELGAELDVLRDALASFDDINPFAELQDSIDKTIDSINDLKDYTSELRDVLVEINDLTVFPRMTESLQQANSEGRMVLDTLSGIRSEIASTDSVAGDNPFSRWNLSDVTNSLSDAVANTNRLDDVAKGDPYSTTVSSVAQLTVELGTATKQAQELATAMREAISGASSLSSSGSRISSSLPKGVTSSQISSWFEGIDPNTLPTEERSAWVQAAMNGDYTSFYEQFGSSLGDVQRQPVVVQAARNHLHRY